MASGFYPLLSPVLPAYLLLAANTWPAQADTMTMRGMPAHDHAAMGQSQSMPNDHHQMNHAKEHSQDHSVSMQKESGQTVRNPDELSDGQDFSHLPKPKMGDEDYLGSVIVDRLEAYNARDEFAMTYDWQAWFGQDYDRAVVRAEGEFSDGAFQNARNELLWGHALTPYWDSHLGIRYDSGLGAERTWGAFGVQGNAPYWIYTEATAYIGEGGRTAFRLELEYDMLITQKLILQPRVEMNFYSRRDPSRLVSSGLSNIETGLRLRYEFAREFAPYIGIEWASSFGSAADQIRAIGNKPEETRFIAGVHFWY